MICKENNNIHLQWVVFFNLEYHYIKKSIIVASLLCSDDNWWLTIQAVQFDINKVTDSVDVTLSECRERLSFNLTRASPAQIKPDYISLIISAGKLPHVYFCTSRYSWGSTSTSCWFPVQAYHINSNQTGSITPDTSLFRKGHRWTRSTINTRDASIF